MAKTNKGIVIEQLYENVPRVTDQGSRNATKKTSPLLKPKARFRRDSSSDRKGSGLDRIDSSYEKSEKPEDTGSNNTTPKPRPRNSSIASSEKSKSPPLLKDVVPKFPITYDVALALFGHKLSSYEHSEITNYENLYYLGLGADKIQASNSSDSESFVYDDNDNFYRTVAHDHIAYRFEITEKAVLGKGTFGQVVKAFDHKEKQMVALKIVRNERVYLKQARDELRILQILRKQDNAGLYNIVHIKEFFMFRNHMCISFELLGMNLYQVLKKNHYRGLGSLKIMGITRCVLRCLELLYKDRIIHCDIKPENIMLKRNGDFTSVKVGDFGSSCYEQQQVYHYIQSRYYRAPEVMLGMRYGPAIDMWSLGCVVSELSTGYPSFTGSNEADQLAAIEEVMGTIPSEMLSKSKAKVNVNAQRSRSRGGPSSKPFHSIVIGDDLFKDFVKQMLRWDPQIRPSPSEIAGHKWIINYSKQQNGKGRKDSASTTNVPGNTKSRQQNISHSI